MKRQTIDVIEPVIEPVTEPVIEPVTGPGDIVEVRDQGHRFDIWHQVPLVPQLGGMSCWAAAAAMLVGWRDRIAVEGPDVARGAGRWREFSAGLHPRDIEDLARVWRLHVVREQHHTVASLRRLLERYGPLWMGEAVPGLHVIVLTGMYGDGSRDNTWIRVNDPWPVGSGERYRLSFRQLMHNFRRANRIAGLHAQILRTSGRPGGNSIKRKSSWRSSLRIKRSARKPRKKTFSLTDEVLSALCRKHAFALPALTTSGGERVLFALRGAQIASPASPASPSRGEFQPSVALVESVPDHVHQRCIVGVWNRASQEIALFRGSTVPSLSGVRQQIMQPQARIANMLPTGRYTYDVGTHRGGRRIVPAALIQRGPVVVQRDFAEDAELRASSWHFVRPVDNVHPAFDEPPGTAFASAGGIAISGDYRDGHRGPWRRFRALTGLDDADGHTFVLILLTGRDAHRATLTNAGDTDEGDLRFGSSGAAVAALQASLARQGLLEPAGQGWRLPAPAFAAATRGQERRVAFPADARGYFRGHTFMAHAQSQ